MHRHPTSSLMAALLAAGVVQERRAPRDDRDLNEVVESLKEGNTDDMDQRRLAELCGCPDCQSRLDVEAAPRSSPTGRITFPELRRDGVLYTGSLTDMMKQAGAFGKRPNSEVPQSLSEADLMEAIFGKESSDGTRTIYLDLEGDIGEQLKGLFGDEPTGLALTSHTIKTMLFADEATNATLGTDYHFGQEIIDYIHGGVEPSERARRIAESMPQDTPVGVEVRKAMALRDAMNLKVASPHEIDDDRIPVERLTEELSDAEIMKTEHELLVRSLVSQTIISMTTLAAVLSGQSAADDAVETLELAVEELEAFRDASLD